MVAIARALSIDARVVIMDEPTAALSHKEIGEFYELVEQLKAQGTAILFISHKFDEILAIADRFTVFRGGQCLSVIMASTETPEILGMSDRVIIVMRDGRIVAELEGDALTPETRVRHAAGIGEG